jgi:hypothetical protein
MLSVYEVHWGTAIDAHRGVNLENIEKIGHKNTTKHESKNRSP